MKTLDARVGHAVLKAEDAQLFRPTPEFARNPESASLALLIISVLVENAQASCGFYRSPL
jgi:hypothetical protein